MFDGGPRRCYSGWASWYGSDSMIIYDSELESCVALFRTWALKALRIVIISVK
jgi:hypothetical protein